MEIDTSPGDASCGFCNGPMPCNCEGAEESKLEKQWEEQQDAMDMYDHVNEMID